MCINVYRPVALQIWKSTSLMDQKNNRSISFNKMLQKVSDVVVHVLLNQSDILFRQFSIDLPSNRILTILYEFVVSSVSEKHDPHTWNILIQNAEQWYKIAFFLNTFSYFIGFFSFFFLVLKFCIGFRHNCPFLFM